LKQPDLNLNISNEIRFPGQYDDKETDLYCNWHRYYNPSLGRYYQADPVELGAVNRYQYVENNPLRYSDPTGELITPQQALCAADHFLKWRNRLQDPNSPYYREDKVVHCATACEISVDCFGQSLTETFILGVGFEVYGFAEKIKAVLEHKKPRPGTGFDFLDIVANTAGLGCAKLKCDCENCCSLFYLL
jgi:RHS repeat-associated protein